MILLVSRIITITAEMVMRKRKRAGIRPARSLIWAMLVDDVFVGGSVGSVASAREGEGEEEGERGEGGGERERERDRVSDYQPAPEGSEQGGGQWPSHFYCTRGRASTFHQCMHIHTHDQPNCTRTGSISYCAWANLPPHFMYCCYTSVCPTIKLTGICRSTLSKDGEDVGLKVEYSIYN